MHITSATTRPTRPPGDKGDDRDDNSHSLDIQLLLLVLERQHSTEQVGGGRFATTPPKIQAKTKTKTAHAPSGAGNTTTKGRLCRLRYWWLLLFFWGWSIFVSLEIRQIAGILVIPPPPPPLSVFFCLLLLLPRRRIIVIANGRMIGWTVTRTRSRRTIPETTRTAVFSPFQQQQQLIRRRQQQQLTGMPIWATRTRTTTTSSITASQHIIWNSSTHNLTTKTTTTTTTATNPLRLNDQTKRDYGSSSSPNEEPPLASSSLPTTTTTNDTTTTTSAESAALSHASSSSSSSSSSSTTNNTLSSATTTTKLYHPREFLKNATATTPIPKALSPSSIIEFRNCRQSFFFQYILGLRQPTNRALVKGTLIHSTLERLFDLEPYERSLNTLHNLFRSQWKDKRESDPYRALFEDPITGQRQLEAERAWGEHALDLLRNYHRKDRPQTFRRPAHREMWVTAHLPVHPKPFPYSMQPPQPPQDAIPTVATSSKDDDKDDSSSSSTVFVRGIVDRLELTKEDDAQLSNQARYSSSNNHHRDNNNNNKMNKNNDKVVLRLCDYKTGKAPVLKYAPWMNEKIVQESFFQLQIYALLMRFKQVATTSSSPDDTGKGPTTTNTSESEGAALPSNQASSPDPSPTFMELRYLRLFYLTTQSTTTNDDCNDGTTNNSAAASSSSRSSSSNSAPPRRSGVSDSAQYLDYDLGATQEERDQELFRVHEQVAQIWHEIGKLCEANDFTAWEGCDRSFCYCHKCRPQFLPGTVWEPPTQEEKGKEDERTLSTMMPRISTTTTRHVSSPSSQPLQRQRPPPVPFTATRQFQTVATTTTSTRTDAPVSLSKSAAAPVASSSSEGSGMGIDHGYYPPVAITTMTDNAESTVSLSTTSSVSLSSHTSSSSKGSGIDTDHRYYYPPINTIADATGSPVSLPSPSSISSSSSTLPGIDADHDYYYPSVNTMSAEGLASPASLSLSASSVSASSSFLSAIDKDHGHYHPPLNYYYSEEDEYMKQTKPKDEENSSSPRPRSRQSN